MGTRSLELHNKTSDLLDAVHTASNTAAVKDWKQECLYLQKEGGKQFFTYMMVLFTFFKGFNFSTHNKKGKMIA